ncbi:DUF4259 domain-containing protein [Streptomyces sp. AM 2-1-1]|uniref:DUF4259 domain-containing protein n=1 Tax=Streptomyces sp. AM 2-1-1 TaxID=3028709 RepID=UPI0023B98862|nr:DUF4259 domain-containing protein [Streptomyces sp. AM 2-1-1]WEH43499.1 DUF4259 domain-containing protein [Streptomyces sp. AM 2-1-1]
MIRGVLKRAAGPPDFLGICDGGQAVGAAALVVAEHSDCDRPNCSNYSTSEPLLELPPRTLWLLAVQAALDRVVSNRSELSELWAEAANWSEWRQDIMRHHDVLDPLRSRHQGGALFEIRNRYDLESRTRKTWSPGREVSDRCAVHRNGLRRATISEGSELRGARQVRW